MGDIGRVQLSAKLARAVSIYGKFRMIHNQPGAPVRFHRRKKVEWSEAPKRETSNGEEGAQWLEDQIAV